MPPLEKTVIVMPAFNEAANITTTLENIAKYCKLPVVVVDDSSTDSTAALASKCRATVLSLSSQLGAWGATQAGLRYALKHGYNSVLTIDADGQHDAQGIPLLLNALKQQKADLVIGSCTSRGSWARRFAWRLFRFLSGLSVKDMTSGFRAYSHAGIRLISQPQGTVLDYQDVGVLCQLRKAGLAIREIEVCMRPRKDGKSRIFNSWVSVFQYMLYSILLSLSHTKLTVYR